MSIPRNRSPERSSTSQWRWRLLAAHTSFSAHYTYRTPFQTRRVGLEVVAEIPCFEKQLEKPRVLSFVCSLFLLTTGCLGPGMRGCLGRVGSNKEGPGRHQLACDGHAREHCSQLRDGFCAGLRNHLCSCSIKRNHSCFPTTSAQIRLLLFFVLIFCLVFSGYLFSFILSD